MPGDGIVGSSELKGMRFELPDVSTFMANFPENREIPPLPVMQSGKSSGIPERTRQGEKH